MVSEITGKAEEQIEIGEGADTNDVCEVLKERYEKLEALNYKIAVNHSIEKVNFLLNEQDEMALLPPFAGG